MAPWKVFSSYFTVTLEKTNFITFVKKHNKRGI